MVNADDGATSSVKKPRVGMVKAVSPSLAREGVFVGVFTKNSVGCIEGRRQNLGEGVMWWLCNVQSLV